MSCVIYWKVDNDGMNKISESSMERDSTKDATPVSELSDDVHHLRKKILEGIIDEAATLINIQASTNRLFIARTCPHAALSLEEAALHHLKKK